jgi:hypothetical protein
MTWDSSAIRELNEMAKMIIQRNISFIGNVSAAIRVWIRILILFRTLTAAERINSHCRTKKIDH